MGLLGWPPDQFWKSTMHDFTAALEGWRIAQGDDRHARRDLARQLHSDLEKFRKKQQEERSGTP